MTNPIFTISNTNQGKNGSSVANIGSPTIFSRKTDGVGPILGQRLLSENIPQNNIPIFGDGQLTNAVFILNGFDTSGSGMSPGIKSDDTTIISVNAPVGTIFSDLEQGLMWYAPSVNNLGTLRTYGSAKMVGFNTNTFFRLMSPSGGGGNNNPWARNTTFDFLAVVNTPVINQTMTVFGVSERGNSNFASIGTISNKIAVRTQSGGSVNNWISNNTLSNNNLYLLHIYSDGVRYKMRINNIDQTVTGSGNPTFQNFFPAGAGRNIVTLGISDTNLGLIQPYSGLLGEVRLYSPGLTDVNRDTVHRNMMSVWGITPGSNLT